MAREALDLARLLGDPDAVAIALEANLIVDRDPALATQRRLWLAELEQLTPDASAAARIAASWARAEVRATDGEVEEALADYGRVGTDVRSKDHPYGRMVAAYGPILDTTRRGDWQGARAALAALRDVSSNLLMDPTAATLSYRAGIGVIDSLEGTARARSEFAAVPFPIGSGGTMLLAGAAMACSPTEARSRLAPLADGLFETMARDLLWPSMVWVVAESAYHARAHDVARSVYDVARPYADLTVIGPGATYLGSFEHHLALLAAAFDDRHRSDAHGAAALVAHHRAGATAWVERTQALLDAPIAGD
jgi:hypothetical protein